MRLLDLLFSLYYEPIYLTWLRVKSLNWRLLGGAIETSILDFLVIRIVGTAIEAKLIAKF